MNWKLKSRIQRTCAALPMGHRLYFALQYTLGGLRAYDFGARFAQQRAMVERLVRHGAKAEGAVVFEVGTGWTPTIPQGFWLCGARTVHTFDLNRHLSRQLLRRSLEWIANNEERLVSIYDGAVEEAALRERVAAARQHMHAPESFLSAAGIQYHAPADASQTGLAGHSIDLHVSTSVFEHIPGAALAGILAEARRVLRPGGTALHVVDPTDHFAHADRSISYANFYQFDEAAWRRYNDNAFAYHNRLTDSAYRALFETSGLTLKEATFIEDPRTRAAVENELALAPPFDEMDPADLSRRELWYFAVNESTE